MIKSYQKLVKHKQENMIKLMETNLKNILLIIAEYQRRTNIE